MLGWEEGLELDEKVFLEGLDPGELNGGRGIGEEFKRLWEWCQRNILYKKCSLKLTSSQNAV
jgi:hypothetical protein